MFKKGENQLPSRVAILLIISIFLSFLPVNPAGAASSFGLTGTTSVSKSTLLIGEEFTLTYKLTPYASNGSSGTATFKNVNIFQPIPFGFQIVSYTGAGPGYNDEVEIKYSQLRIYFKDMSYTAGKAVTPSEINIRIVYKGKPAQLQFGDSSLSYVLNDDWDHPTQASIPIQTLTFKNRITGPSTQFTEPTLEGTLTAPSGTIFVGDPFAMTYSVSPNIEIERRDQSDYIVLWNISSSMNDRYVPADSGTMRRIDAARDGFASLISRLRSYYPGDQEENYAALPDVGVVQNEGAAIVQNQFTASFTMSKPLKRRTGPQVGAAPRVTLIPFNSGILYDDIIEQTNDYTLLLNKVNSLAPTGVHTDVTRALDETMDYVLYEREQGNPDYQPTIIMVTDGYIDTATGIRNERYESCYCTESRIPEEGQINRAVEKTYDFDNLYLAIEIPLHLIKLADPTNTELNYTEGFNALQNIVNRSGGAIYTTMGDDGRSYKGKSYTGVRDAFTDLVDKTEASRKSWASYRNIVLTQTVPAGMKLADTSGGVTLSGTTLRIPLANFDYNSGPCELKATVKLIFKGAAGVYDLSKANLGYQANSAAKQSAVNGVKLTFKDKSPPEVVVGAPGNPGTVVDTEFLIVRGEEPQFTVKATDEENITSLKYAFMSDETDPLNFTAVNAGGQGLGKQFTLSFNNGSLVKSFDHYGWYKLTVQVANSLELSTTKVTYVLVLPELGLDLQVQSTGSGASAKPVTTLLKWANPEIRRPIAGNFSMPGVKTVVEYALENAAGASSGWKQAPFDKIQVMRDSKSRQLLKVRVTQSFDANADAPFDGIDFNLEKSAYLSIDYDQKKY